MNTLPKKDESFSPGSPQLPTATQLGVEHFDPFPLHAGILTSLVSCK